MSHPLFFLISFIGVFFLASISSAATVYADSTEYTVNLSENPNLGEKNVGKFNYNIDNMLWNLLSIPLIMYAGITVLTVLRLFTFSEVSITNVEERAKKLQGKGIEHFLRKTNAELIDRSKRENELYEIKMFRTYRLKWLKYEDPSTPGKIYGCFVPSEMEKADQAMAWKFYITEEEYDSLEIET